MQHKIWTKINFGSGDCLVAWLSSMPGHPENSAVLGCLKCQCRNILHSSLHGRNRAIVIAESLARVIAAIRIAGVRPRSYLPHQNTEISPHRPCVRCAAIQIARLAFIRLTIVPRGLAEWHARVDRIRWTLAIGDWRFCPSKHSSFYP